MPEFAPVINVSTLNGNNGFRLFASDNAGQAVSGGGDVNGDGFDDVLIGAPLADPGLGGNNRGIAWVVFGAVTSPGSQTLNVRVSAGTAYQFHGEVNFDSAGFSVSNAGDVNGDGFDDLIIGARNAGSDVPGSFQGSTYLVFGGVTHLEALDKRWGPNDNRIDLADIVPAHGFRFDGRAGEVAGARVSGAGDIDGDGFDDLVISAYYAETLGRFNNGVTYVVFGGGNLGSLDVEDGTADGRIDLRDISAGQGMRLHGANGGDFVGTSVSAGDVNGDGFADVILGASSVEPNGAAYIVFGQKRGDLPKNLDLATVDGITVTRLDGVAANDSAGGSVSGLGDINGDGFDDVLIGAAFADPNGLDYAGSAYVVFGKSTWDASLNLGALTGLDGFRLDSPGSENFAGSAVSAAGDVNGDGFLDLVIGSRPYAGGGAAYVVFGKATGFAATIDLGALDGNNGFRIDGAVAGDHLGQSVAAAGDVNGDGFDDLVVGAPNAGAADTGSTYIIYGHRANSAVDRIGTDLANRINGGKGNDTVTGLGGNDTLLGWEGDDTIQGGFGRDKVIVAGGEDELHGGSGADTLSFEKLNNPVTVNLATGQVTLPNGDVQTFVSFENVIGTSGGDTITGDAEANALSGGGGKDTIAGGAGSDTLTGGGAQDQLNGNAGLDRFVYTALAESGTSAAARDLIVGFSDGEDKINVSAIDAKAGGGTNAGNQAFTFDNTFGIGDIRATQSGADTRLEFNTDNDGEAEMSILLKNLAAVDVDGADFIL